MRNNLPVSIIDFKTLTSFKKSLDRIDLTGSLPDVPFPDCFLFLNIPNVQFNRDHGG